MTEGVRNKLLAMAATSFVMMATGVTLRLHFAHSRNPSQHDAKDCRICQLLLKASKKITVDLDPPVLDDWLLTFVADACPTEYIQTHCPHQSLPRGPPSSR